MNSKTAYCIFSGTITHETVQRFFERFALLSQNGFDHAHVLLQSSGGAVSDGVCLYNFFRTLPLGLTLYNGGIVGSIAAIAYLGAPKRLASKGSTFMVHRTQLGPITTTGMNIDAYAKNLAALDASTDMILHQHLKLTGEQWEAHRVGDLWFTADEGKACGLCTDLGDFSPPMGQMLTYI